MQVLYFLFVCGLLYEYADGESAPFITPCHASDSACLKSSAQKAVPVVAAGVPSLDITSLDPLHLDRVTASQAGLNMDFRNTVVKGMKNCVVDDLKRKDMKTTLELRCSVVLTGDYTLGGKLLILPIEGNGKFKIKIRDIVVKLMYDLKDRTVNGEKFWVMHNVHHTADVKTGAEYNFQNLFNGNKQLGDSIHAFANSHWKDIFQEVAPPIVDAIVGKVVVETKKLFEKVPENQLALP